MAVKRMCQKPPSLPLLRSRSCSGSAWVCPPLSPSTSIAVSRPLLYASLDPPISLACPKSLLLIPQEAPPWCLSTSCPSSRTTGHHETPRNANGIPRRPRNEPTNNPNKSHSATPPAPAHVCTYANRVWRRSLAPAWSLSTALLPLGT